MLSPELDLAFGRRRKRPPPPRWLAELLSEVVTALGPRGAEFAKGSIDRDLATFSVIFDGLFRFFWGKSCDVWRDLGFSILRMLERDAGDSVYHFSPIFVA